jgi:SH3-like domain-containing protein
MIAFITRTIEEKNKKYAIVFSLSSEIKSSPDENGTNLYLIHYGLKVEIIDELNNWIKIILPDGKMGWMKNDSVEII